MILSNKSAFTVPGKNLKVVVSMAMVRKDLSGQTSSSDSVTGGNKPKKISVALTLGFSQVKQLRALTAVAEALDKSGDPVVYTVADDTCEAMNIRQVRFCDTLRVKEGDKLQAWDVSFTLQEHRSVAEKKEQRAKADEVKTKGPDGKEVAPPKEDSDQDGDTKSKDLSLFEKVLQGVEQMLPDIS